MWYEITVLSWLGFWLAIALGMDVVEFRPRYIRDVAVIGIPLIIVTICKLIWG